MKWQVTFTSMLIDADSSEEAIDRAGEFKGGGQWEAVPVPEVGEKIKAFHPTKMGVVEVGTVVEPLASNKIRIDFGELLGGKFFVAPEHVVGPA